MRVPDAKIEQCASTDESRPVLTHVCLRDGYLEATDSFRFVRVKVELDDSDVDGLIPVEAFVTARKWREPTMALTATEAVLTRNDGAKLAFPRPTFDNFPSYTEIRKVQAKDKPTGTVRLDAKLLLGVAQALSGSDRPCVELEARGPVTAIIVSTGNAADCEAMLMPVRGVA